MKYKIVLIEERFNNHDIEKSVFSQANCEVIEAGHIKDIQELSGICSNADAILVNLFKMDKDFISKLKKCKVIGRYGIGYDNVDVIAAAGKGIKVVNVPNYCTNEVVEHILALLFTAVRNITIKDLLVREGKWNIKGTIPVHRMAGKKLGIVGYGKTGTLLHKRAVSLGFSEIIIFDRSAEKKVELLKQIAGETKASFTDLDYLVSNCDFISLNLPLTDKTKYLIGSREFEMMKKNAIIINVSRGAIIDTEALSAALVSKRIAGAALDVHEIEPLPSNSTLFDINNLVITDHTAWHSIESQEDLQRMCASNVLDVLLGKPCASIVND
jgi:D-3-phosphoglycerate dehydrogenase